MTTTVLTQLQFLDRLRKIQSDYDYTNTVYKNLRTKVSVVCRKHGKFFTSPTRLLAGRGCNICDRLSNSGRTPHLSLTEYISVASEIHNNVYNYAHLVKLEEKIWVRCEEHGMFLIRRSAHISSSQLYGCQKCGNTRSRGEDAIIRYLTNNNIDYTYQKTFDWVKSIGGKHSLRYDFFIESRNLLIEFDGRHHFDATTYGGQSIESAILQTRRTKFYDGIKSVNAMLAGIRLIRIYYNRFSDIDDILQTEMLQKTNNLIGIYK